MSVSRTEIHFPAIKHYHEYTLLFKYTYGSNQTKIKPNKYKNGKNERSGSVNKNNKRAIELVEQ